MFPTGFFTVASEKKTKNTLPLNNLNMNLRKVSHVPYIRIRHTHRNTRNSEAGRGGLADACLTNASEAAQKQLDNLYRASSTIQLNQKTSPGANSSRTAGNRTNLQAIRVPLFNFTLCSHVLELSRTCWCALLMALPACLGADACCLLNFTTSVTYALPMAIALSVLHSVTPYCISNHKCKHR